MNITESELLDAIREAARDNSSDPQGAMTVVELADAMNLDVRIARKHVATLLRSGSMECVRVRRPSIDGRIIPIPAYRLVAAPAKKKVIAPERWHDTPVIGAKKAKR